MNDHAFSKLSIPTLVGVLGLCICSCSIAMPAFDHGDTISVMAYLGFALLFSFFGNTSSMVMFCRLTIFAVVTSLVTFALGTLAPSRHAIIVRILFALQIMSLALLVSIPYDGIEKVHLGYYLWIFGQALIGVGGLIGRERVSEP